MEDSSAQVQQAAARTSSGQRLRRPAESVPGCIKLIILAVLLALLAAEIGSGFQIASTQRSLASAPLTGGTFFGDNWLLGLIILITILLIILILILMRVQRSLRCEITSPAVDACVAEQVDPIGGKQYISVVGTASGTVFGHYTLSISGPYAYSVDYPPIPPGGGASGTTPVVGGELGRIDTTALDAGSYTVTLTVYPAGGGSTCIYTVTFTLLKVMVYITTVAGLFAVPNCFDETAELVSGFHVRSVGGGMHMTGAAYVYACTGRKVSRYEIRYSHVTVPGGEPPQPPTNAPALDVAPWPAGNLVHLPLVYDPSKYWPWTEIGPIPTNLINDWGTLHLGAPSPGGTDYPILVPSAWDSTVVGSGRYDLLLKVDDTASNTYYDTQRVWLDNWLIIGQILRLERFVGGMWKDIEPCADLLMSWGKIRILGLAWDPVIDLAFPATAPNDNYAVPGGGYQLTLEKQLSGVWSALFPFPPPHPTPKPFPLSPTRVPAALSPTPTAANADVLAEWDLSTLDPASPTPVDAANQLARGHSCDYLLRLYVTDTTLVNEGKTHNNEDQGDPYEYFPCKVVNDL